MKPFLITAIILSTAITTMAQIYFDAVAGVSISNIKTTVNGKDDNFNSDIGFIVTVNLNKPMGDNLLLQVGLQYESYRAKMHIKNISNNYKEVVSGKTHVEYLNVPVKLLYHLKAGSKSVLIGTGIYLGIGMYGHSSSAVYSETDYGGGVIYRETRIEEVVVSFGARQGQLKQLNMGVGLLASYQMQRNVCISVYANIGLVNLNNWQHTMTNLTAAGVTAGYMFDCKKKKQRNKKPSVS